MKPLPQLSYVSTLLLLLGCEAFGGAHKSIPLSDSIEEETLTSVLKQIDSDGDIQFRYSHGDPLYYVDSISVHLRGYKTKQTLELTRIRWMISESERLEYCRQIDALYEKIKALIPGLPLSSEYPTIKTGVVIKSRRDNGLRNIVRNYLKFNMNRPRAP